MKENFFNFSTSDISLYIYVCVHTHTHILSSHKGILEVKTNDMGSTISRHCPNFGLQEISFNRAGVGEKGFHAAGANYRRWSLFDFARNLCACDLLLFVRPLLVCLMEWKWRQATVYFRTLQSSLHGRTAIYRIPDYLSALFLRLVS